MKETQSNLVTTVSIASCINRNTRYKHKIKVKLNTSIWLGSGGGHYQWASVDNTPVFDPSHSSVSPMSAQFLHL